MHVTCTETVRTASTVARVLLKKVWIEMIWQEGRYLASLWLDSAACTGTFGLLELMPMVLLSGKGTE